MKEFLYGWIRDIAFYAILMTVILHLLPEEGQKKYVRFFMGVVLMLVFCKCPHCGAHMRLRERKTGYCPECGEKGG